MKKSIFITTHFEGFHCWPDAPEEVAFLRSYHRHVFHVRAEKTVSHDDRDIEFILLKREIDRFIKKSLGQAEKTSWSCEMWAKFIMDAFDLDLCEVSEDGENGAIVRR